MNVQTGIIDIRGKQYQTVALRVQHFREKHPDHSLTTAIVCRDDDCVVMQATIGDPTGRVIATGHSEEYRRSSTINKTSALENAETSAIGRALAAFGMAGTEFASANEVVNAIHQQGAQQEAARGQRQEKGKVSPAASELREQLEQSVEQETKHDARKNPWGEFYSGRSALHKGLGVHDAELRRLADEGTFKDLDQYCKSPEYVEFIHIASDHARHYLEGGPPAPPEFVGIFDLEQRARDMIGSRNDQPLEPNILQAG